MKNFMFILLLSACVHCTPDHSAQDCHSFRQGRFTYSNHEFDEKFEIIRTDSLQTETNLNTKTSQVSRVVWKTACEYYLYKIISDNLHPFVDSIRGKKPLKVVMTEVTKDYYICTASIEGISFVYSDTIFRAK
jgi:hypothetical protein